MTGKLYAVAVTGCEIAVLVNEDGTSTNRFADGVAGVQKELQEEAEANFDPASDPVVGEE